MGSANQEGATIYFPIKTLSFGVLVLLLVLFILFPVFMMTGSALPDDKGSEQLNSDVTALYVLDAGHHHLGGGEKPALTPDIAEGTIYTKKFVLDGIDSGTAGITLTTKSVVPTDCAGTGLFYNQVYVNGNKVGKLNDYIEAKEQDNLPRQVTIYFSTQLLHSGENNMAISSGCNADCSDFDDFEFYDLTLEIFPERKYQYSEKVSPPLKKIWSTSTGGYFHIPLPEVSKSGEVIFYTSSLFDSDTTLNKETINAIDARNGQLVWSYETGGSKNIDDQVVYDEGLVFASDYENIYAFGDNGLEWKFDCKQYWDEYNTEPFVRPVVYDNTVYTTIDNAGNVLAIDARTGVLKWTYSFRPWQEHQDKDYWIRYDSTFPAVGKRTVVLIAQVEYREKVMEAAIEPGRGRPKPPQPDTKTFTRVFALNASNGEEIWNYSINSVFHLYDRSPFIYHDLVYSGLEDKIVARTLGTGRIIWSSDVPSPHIYAVSDGKVFAIEEPDVVAALDAYNGSLVWRRQAHPGSLSVYGGLVYVGINGKENLLVLDGNTGEYVWKGGRTFGSTVSQPVLSHGRLYMSASDSRIYAFEHGDPVFQDINAIMVGNLPFFAIGVMLVLLITFFQKIENKSLALGSWLLVFSVVLFLSIIIKLEYIPIVGWALALLLVLILPMILMTGLSFLAYGIWQKRKMERSDDK